MINQSINQSMIYASGLRSADTWLRHHLFTSFLVFTARCYGERGYATVSRLSVRNVQVP